MSQRTLPILVAASLLSVAAGAVAGMFAADRAAPETGVAASQSNDDRAAIEALVQRQAELERGIADLRTRLEMAPAADSRSAVSGDDVAAAVDAWMREHRSSGDAPALAATSQPDAAAAARNRERALSDAIAQLKDPNLKDADRLRIWKEMFDAGLGDQLVAEFEARAERNPNDPDARVDLAEAYLQKLFTVSNGPEMGMWGAKADKAFDAALALDENHWSARFGKAVALSNWPAFLGKQPEAIKHFEQLIAQQSRAPKQTKFAQTHLILGNMYLQSGQKAKAVATWQDGLAQYPDNEALRKQLELSLGD